MLRTDLKDAANGLDVFGTILHISQHEARKQQAKHDRQLHGSCGLSSDLCQMGVWVDLQCRSRLLEPFDPAGFAPLGPVIQLFDS